MYTSIKILTNYTAWLRHLIRQTIKGILKAWYFTFLADMLARNKPVVYGEGLLHGKIFLTITDIYILDVAIAEECLKLAQLNEC
jgi:hypothetical protein